MGSQKRGRGRPRREYQIRVRAERRATPDYQKLARALLEHAAMEEAARRETSTATGQPVPSHPEEDTEVDS